MEGAGSAIIVLRHLRRLKASGWKIHIVGDWGHDDQYCRAEGWPVFQLPLRKRFWPPYKDSIWGLREIRYWLWCREIHRWLGSAQPDAVLTYLSAFSDTLSQVAASYASRNRLPLTCLIHDDCEAFKGQSPNRKARYKSILRHSTQNWFVSPELAQAYGFPGDDNEVLPPISEASSNRSNPSQPPSGKQKWVYAGNVRDPQVPVLASIATELEKHGAQLLVLAEKTPELEAALKTAPIQWQPPFPTNREALNWLQENANVLLAAYAADSRDQPWIRSSFPSKFIEYLHLGLPVIVAAPQDSAISAWARKHQWQDILHPSDANGLRSYCNQIQNSDEWLKRAKLARTFGKQFFDPEIIQHRFESGLIPATKQHP